MGYESIYKIVKAASTDDLEKKIDKMLAKKPNWDIAGGLIATSDAYGRVFYQAIKKTRIVRKKRAQNKKKVTNEANAKALLEGRAQGGGDE